MPEPLELDSGGATNPVFTRLISVAVDHVELFAGFDDPERETPDAVVGVDVSPVPLTIPVEESVHVFVAPERTELLPVDETPPVDVDHDEMRAPDDVVPVEVVPSEDSIGFDTEAVSVVRAIFELWVVGVARAAGT